MADIKCEKQDGILVVTMMRGKANALNLGMVEELNAAADEAASDEAIRGVVLASDRPRFFSSGFDATEVFRYNQGTMALFFSRFIDLYESLYLLPKPVVAAISGNAYAGGAILALSCDIRILAKGSFGFALNEINLGVVLPAGIIRMAVGAAGTNYAREMLLFGDPLTPARALEIGLAYSLVEPEEVLKTAISRCSTLAQKPGAAFAAIKHSLRELNSHSTTEDDKRILCDFLESWFSDETERRKQALLKSLAIPVKE